MSQCGCCTPGIELIPVDQTNRPGLSAVVYRLGTFASFRHDVLRRIAFTPELARLRTRSSDDYAVSIAELWAVVADVLTFYQERIANEGFLGTALMRDSVLRMVRLLGYELRPGAAATTLLAFTIEPGKRALIPTELRVQSVPIQDEKPQKYETIESVMADARLNRLGILGMPATIGPLNLGRSREIFAPGAAVFAAAAALTPGNRIIAYASNQVELLTVKQIAPAIDLLSVTWEVPPSTNLFPAGNSTNLNTAGAFKVGRTFRLFGYNAPSEHVKAVLAVSTDPTSWKLDRTLTDFSLAGGGGNDTTLYLDAKYDDLKPGARLLVVGNGGGSNTYRLITVATAVQERATRSPVSEVVTKITAVGAPALTSVITGSTGATTAVIYELIGQTFRFWPYDLPPIVAGRTLMIPGKRAGWSSIQVGRVVEKDKLTTGAVLDVSEIEIGRQLLLVDGEGAAPTPALVTSTALVGSNISVGPTEFDPDTIKLIGFGGPGVQSVTAIVSAPFGTVTLNAARREFIITIGELPPQTIQIDPLLGTTPTRAALAASLQTTLRAALAAPAFAKARVFDVANSLLFVAGVPGVAISFQPTTEDRETIVALRLNAERVRFLDGLVSEPFVSPPIGISGAISMTKGIDTATGFFLMAAPITPAAMALELATVTNGFAHADAENRILLLPLPQELEQREFLRLTIEPSAAFALDADSAAMLGNVAAASHGETVRNEILGDGDAARAFQRFLLKKKPVTHLPAATPTGIESSLQLFVNGVRWREVDTLYGAGENEQVYVSQVADDGTLTALTGDGTTGARLPTGRANIVARYRQGVGLGGRVRANSLTTLLDRPNGLKSVTNPTAADGGADPEILAHARTAAPGTVRSFGRAVSLRDFQDVAIAAGDVAKAQASWVWAGHQRVVHVTVAAHGGASFSADGLDRIRNRLFAQRDPNHTILIDNFVRVPVTVAAKLIVHADYINDNVLRAARAALLDALSFDRMGFGQAVNLSDVYAVLQGVSGVVAVDIDDLNFKSIDPTFLAAHGATTAKPQPSLRMLRAHPDPVASVVYAAEQAFVEVPAQDILLTASGGQVL